MTRGEKISASLRRHWAENAEYRQRQSERLRALHRDPVWHEGLMRALHLKNASARNRESMSARMRGLWADSEYRTRMLARFAGRSTAAHLASYRRRRDECWAGPLDAELRRLVAEGAYYKTMEHRLGFSRSAIQRRMADLGLER